MKISVPTWSFPALTLPETAAVAKALGLDAIDVGLFYTGALDKAALLAKPDEVAAATLEHGMSIANYYHLFGDGLEDRTISDPKAFDANATDLEAVLRFCSAGSIPSVFLLPGVLAPGQRAEDAFEASSRFLSYAVERGNEHGVQVTVEPHVHSIVESPDAVLRLLDATPGLKLALDHAHFVCLGYTQEAIDPLLPHAAHVHFRQARAGRLQERLPYGTINFRLLLSSLTRVGYDGWISAEPLHQDYIDSWNVDVISEVIGFRDLVRNHDAGLA
jgi:sugar phosphate isomerase/epimerase